MAWKPNVPQFSQLPRTIRDDFMNAGCDDWYRSAQPPLQLTLLNTYASMKDHNLWEYVDRCVDAQPGRMVFEVGQMGALKGGLRIRDDFTNPTRSPWDWLRGGNELWDSRSKDTSLGQLHLKQFDGWETKNYVQAHIDVEGMNRYNPYRWIKHAFDEGWKDPFKANETLWSMPRLRTYLPTR